MQIDRVVERAYLERCADAFMEHLTQGAFETHMREWTVFGGETPKDPLGFYDSFASAIAAGYQTYGLKSFLVRKITPDYLLFGKWGAPKNFQWEVCRTYRQEVKRTSPINCNYVAGRIIFCTEPAYTIRLLM